MRTFLACAIAFSASTGALAQAWNCYGGNAQHTSVYIGSSQAVKSIHWQASMDDDRSYYGGAVLVHFASPMVTAQNTLICGYRYTTTVGGSHDYDNWEVMARSGVDGSPLWTLKTDYSAALIYPNDWTSVFPMTLCKLKSLTAPTPGLAVAGAGGSILVRPANQSATLSGNTGTRLVFYTTVADFNAHKAAYAPVKINTPLTADNAGNIYFGYDVTGSVPPNLSSLGSGGIAKVNVLSGQSQFVSTAGLGLSYSVSRSAMNAAPALSNDGNSIYVALVGGDSVLARLSTSTLAATASTILYDPSIPGAEASLIDESSASPMVAPDGHVFMGVFGNQWRESHGWMLQFDGNLVQTDSNSKRYPVGAFGWDDTAAVVPVSIVSAYTGAASYLILTKYNNYDDSGSDSGADGSNKVAVIDPTSDSTTVDRQSGIPVMNEILTLLSPLRTNNDSSHPDARYEWCINSAAVDINKRGAIVNCEDGHTYRWSFDTNSITESLDLQPATGEAYTCTCIGPDGQIYAMNNCILFAIGNAQGHLHASLQGKKDRAGTLPDNWFLF